MSDSIRIASHTYDVSYPFGDERGFGGHFLGLIRDSLESGANVVVFPEYACQALARLPGWSNERISAYVWKQLYPEVRALSHKHGALVCAGSAPWETPRGLVNRALLAASGQEVVAEKRCLTPWETADFVAGEAARVFDWNGLKVACLICFDCEFPEIAAGLKSSDPHLVLVPSATSDRLGVERVTRCASARAVELGAVTVVSPLVGTEMSNPLVDVNVGKCAVYLPAQEAFRDDALVESALCERGFHSVTRSIDRARLLQVKVRDSETKPFVRGL